MRDFVKKYLDPDKHLKILEVGSFCTAPPEKNRIFRRYFNNKNWDFTGLDMAEGFNVDVVAQNPYKYPFEDESFDIVISGNTLEHVEDTHRWIKELTRLTKNLVCIIVPSSRPQHRYPVDCWRVFPDGMRFLLKDIAELNILECRLCSGEDTIGIATKLC